MIDYSIKAIPTRYRGHLYRSRLEAKWAAFFTLLGWQHEYEPVDFGTWSPDFAIKGADGPIYVEVKPITAYDQAVGSKMATAAGEHVLVGLTPMVALDGLENYPGMPGFGWFAPEDGTLDGQPDPIMGGAACLSAIAAPGGDSIGLVSAWGSYRDRISGLYDGDHYLRSSFTVGGMQLLWGKACELVQWHKNA